MHSYPQQQINAWVSWYGAADTQAEKNDVNTTGKEVCWCDCGQEKFSCESEDKSGFLIDCPDERSFISCLLRDEVFWEWEIYLQSYFSTLMLKQLQVFLLKGTENCDKIMPSGVIPQKGLRKTWKNEKSLVPDSDLF